ncbi:hypothetical protein GQ43DRAFT_477363 [Delitschia confertaspora ATCC 74209]|uniref:Uncharacterized protein n=1 Tax=Delitschia confertaspora ATCC 74209 TaxID=1513339 RepID=A0A9P4JXS6_9PLEO|nr:hypothetical protein GQ43DRAFT_477363 [Delitschia confertaspora ATCC 74209]
MLPLPPNPGSGLPVPEKGTSPLSAPHSRTLTPNFPPYSSRRLTQSPVVAEVRSQIRAQLQHQQEQAPQIPIDPRLMSASPTPASRRTRDFRTDIPAHSLVGQLHSRSQNMALMEGRRQMDPETQIQDLRDQQQRHLNVQDGIVRELQGRREGTKRGEGEMENDGSRGHRGIAMPACVPAASTQRSHSRFELQNIQPNGQQTQQHRRPVRPALEIPKHIPASLMDFVKKPAHTSTVPSPLLPPYTIHPSFPHRPNSRFYLRDFQAEGASPLETTINRGYGPVISPNEEDIWYHRKGSRAANKRKEMEKIFKRRTGVRNEAIWGKLENPGLWKRELGDGDWVDGSRIVEETMDRLKGVAKEEKLAALDTVQWDEWMSDDVLADWAEEGATKEAAKDATKETEQNKTPSVRDTGGESPPIVTQMLEQILTTQYEHTSDKDAEDFLNKDTQMLEIMPMAQDQRDSMKGVECSSNIDVSMAKKKATVQDEHDSKTDVEGPADEDVLMGGM